MTKRGLIIFSPAVQELVNAVIPRVIILLSIIDLFILQAISNGCCLINDIMDDVGRPSSYTYYIF